MNNTKKNVPAFLFVFLFVPCLIWGAAYDPVVVYLTWQKDPTTTMTVQWITEQNKEQDDVYFQKEGDSSWSIAVGSHEPMPHDEPYLIHRAELTNLQPGATYLFRSGEWNSSIYKFRTMPPALKEPIRFVVGGDMYHDGLEYLIETNREAAKANPHFGLVGGDIAYSGSKYANKPHSDEGKRWLRWLMAWKEHMITPDGHMIPMIPAIGNHDVNGRYGQNSEQAKFFYALFAFPGPRGYNVLDFGDYLSLFILDSGHTNPIAGEQTSWLYHQLGQRKNVKHKFALYHVPAFPSVRKFKGTVTTQVRQNWVPVFEHFGLTAAFENHDHSYKRTPLIYQGEAAEQGVLYMGDGAWGVKSPRKPKNPEKEWYLAETKKERHFILVTIDAHKRAFAGVDHEGKVFDLYEQNAPSLLEAAH